jgi:hypothetical protein
MNIVTPHPSLAQSEECRVGRNPPPFSLSCDIPDQRKLVESTIDSSGASPRLLHQRRAMKRKHHQDSEPCSPSAFSSTISTLASICGVPALLEEIQYSCDVLKQVQLEAWDVANLHVLRVFSSLSREQRATADDLLKIDQSFIYSCYSSTLQSTEERDRQERERRGHSRLEVKHPELYRTTADYWEERRQVSSYTPMESFVYGGASLNETAALMAINAANAIALNFRKRLYQFIRFL